VENNTGGSAYLSCFPSHWRYFGQGGHEDVKERKKKENPTRSKGIKKKNEKRVKKELDAMRLNDVPTWDC
jgi:hypothetical protein